MPQISETAGLPPNQLYGALLAGIEDISQQKPVTFYTYARRVLPLDGFVFWLRTGEFSQQGMLHNTAERSQNEDDTVTTDRVRSVRRADGPARTRRSRAAVRAARPGTQTALRSSGACQSM